MTVQKALWLPKVGAELRLGEHAIPEPGPGQVLVKLEAASLNPIDWKIQQSGFFAIKKYPVILGQEGAGVVLKVGDGVSNLAQGDNVFFKTTFDNRFASFQEYCLVVAELAAKMPPNLSFDQGASILAAFSPFAVATYAQRPQGIGLTPPFEAEGLGKYAGEPIVIFGGAASVGQQAIQLANLSGFSPIITTASLHNQDLLLSLGATHVLDRRLPGAALVKRVREIANAPIDYIFDAVSIKETQEVGYALLASGGTLAVVESPQVGSDDGSEKEVLMVKGTFHPPPARALGAKFARALTQWLGEGKLKANHIEVVPGGLNGVGPGLKCLARGVSATKLVVRLPETGFA